MNRIRYQPTDKKEIQVSVKVYVTPDGAEHQVYINSVTMAFGIVRLKDQAMVSYGGAKTFARTKMAAKKALVKLGVVLQKEERKKRNVKAPQESTEAS